MKTLESESFQVGQLLYFIDGFSNYLSVVTKKFDSFMIIEYKDYLDFRHSVTIYFGENPTCLNIVTRNGDPVIARKNIFGRYKIKLP